MKKSSKAAEINLLNSALSAFMQHFSSLGKLELEAIESPPQQPGTGRPDALVRLTAGKERVIFQAEIKDNISHTLRLYAMMKKGQLQRPLLLVARYVNPEMAERLKKDGLEFVDTAGNAFINRAHLHIYVSGNKAPGRAPLAPRRRLFKASGLKVIFALLSRPALITANIRQIASASGVSLGTAVSILDELKTRLYLVEKRKRNRLLVRKKELFEGWVTAYPESLRPKLFLGRYQGHHGWWHDKVLQPTWAQWGGEVAVTHLTNYLFPQIVTIYMTRSHLNEFLSDSKLQADNNGNVEILEKFWLEDGREQGLETAHPIIVYADLLASGDERNIEAAKMIYDRHIARYLRED